MNLLLMNILLAFAWAALSGTFTIGGLMVGFGLGFVALWVVRSLFPGSTYHLKAWRWAKLVVLFLWELIVSSVAVAWDVLTPRHRARPGIVAVPMTARGEGEVLLVTNLISLTPGTLSLDVTEDCRTLYVHAMFADDPDAIRASIANGMERWVREAME